MRILRETYIVATEAAEPIGAEVLREAFEADDVRLVFGEEGVLFSVRADTSRVDVRFDSQLAPLDWTPDLLTGPKELKEQLERAKGFYRIAFEPGRPQPSAAVFEALWTVRLLVEQVQGVVVDVSAFKLHSPQDIEEITELDFDIRDHVTIHAVEFGERGRLWVHTHGLSKFKSPDVEMFSIGEEDLAAAETFFHELCTDLSFGHGPQARQIVSTSVGRAFTLLPAEEGRTQHAGQDLEAFDGHQATYLTVVTDEGKHAMGEILAHFRERFEEETEDEARALQDRADRFMPAFKARFRRRGLMEPLMFLVRAPFEVHPDGERGEPGEELLWVEVLQWEEKSLVGRLVDGGRTSTEWRKGSHVEVDESQINALGLNREGRSLEGEEIEALLQAERPA